MPGIFGAAGVHIRHLDALEEAFRDAWGDVEVHRPGPARGLGWHSFAATACLEIPGNIVARDGEWRAYHAESGEPQFCGNEVTLLADRPVELRADLTGAFPLYYSGGPDGLAFSSLLRPLGKALAASPDQVAISQFLRTAYTCAGRSFFEGISRLLPGQVVRWRPGKGPSVEETSTAWVGVDHHLSTPEQVAEEALPLLLNAVESGLASDRTNVLMMSAGWDSRTLLAAARTSGVPLEAFSHGDLESRELRIARELSEVAGVAWSGRSIGPDVWEPEHLDLTFQRTETLVFPHWAWAGRSNEAPPCTFSGVLGEVLGGHYGATQLMPGSRKAVALLKGLRPGAGEEEITPEDIDRFCTRFTPGQVGRLWYLRDEVEQDQAKELRRALRNDVSRDLERLRSRGITTWGQLLESFVTEHRGVQYITAQALSSRVGTDVAIPFADRPFFRFASRVPPHLKIHNRVNRALARRVAPDLLKFPMAATLAPASAPVLVQEASRLVRKVYEEARRAASRRTGGRIAAPRLGWVNFRFLREESAFHQAMKTLSCDLWDRGSLERRAGEDWLRPSVRSLHPLFDQIGKIMTVDRLLSR